MWKRTVFLRTEDGIRDIGVNGVKTCGNPIYHAPSTCSSLVTTSRSRHISHLVSTKQLVLFQAEDGIRDIGVTGVQTCALPISSFTGFLRYLLPDALAPRI